MFQRDTCRTRSKRSPKMSNSIKTTATFRFPPFLLQSLHLSRSTAAICFGGPFLKLDHILTTCLLSNTLFTKKSAFAHTRFGHCACAMPTAGPPKCRDVRHLDWWIVCRGVETEVRVDSRSVTYDFETVLRELVVVTFTCTVKAANGRELLCSNDYTV